MIFDTRKFYMKNRYTNHIKKYRNKRANLQDFLFFMSRVFQLFYFVTVLKDSLSFTDDTTSWGITKSKLHYLWILFLPSYPVCYCVIWALVGESFGGLVHHASLPLHFEPTANQTQQPNGDKNISFVSGKAGLEHVTQIPPRSIPGVLLELK